MKPSRNTWAVWLVIATLICSCKARKPWIANLRRAQVLVNSQPADAILELERAKKAGADATDVKKGLGIAHERLRHYDEARRLLREVSAERPDDPEVRFELANIAVVQKHVDEARAELETTLPLKPPHPSSLLLYAALARTPLHGKVGLDAFNRIDRRQFAALAESAEYAFARACLLATTGDLVAAEAALAEGNQRNSVNPDLALGLAEVSRASNTARFAEWLLTRASNTLNATESIHMALAEIAIAQGHLSLASAAVSKLQLYDKPTLKALLLLADLHALKNEHAERARVLKRALDLIPKDDLNQQREVAMRYALAWQRAGNLKESESAVIALLDRQPGFPAARLLLAQLCLAQKRPDQAIEISETVAKGEPMRTEAYRVLVAAHLFKKSPSQAEAAARRFVQSSNSPDSVALLANLLIDEKRVDAALREVELGLAHHPDDAGLVAAQIALTERTKGFSKAESVALAANAGNKSPRIQLELARLYTRNQRFDKAINAMQQVAATDSRVLLELSALQVQAGALTMRLPRYRS